MGLNHMAVKTAYERNNVTIFLDDKGNYAGRAIEAKVYMEPGYEHPKINYLGEDK